ncbi:MAG: CDP-archaeol synthase [Microbacteriaceae bacterium]|nr:CDP-archaeol synthase [Microbacteriaceae bacterium]
MLESALSTASHAISLLLPLTVAGLVFIAAMRKGWFAALQIPLDGGLLLGGRPLIGPSKSLRSLVFYAVLGTAVTVLLHLVAPLTPLVAPVFLENPFILGPVTAVLYVAGEVFNSFVKRRLGIPTSASPARGLGALIQQVMDTIDGTLASGLVLLVAYRVPWETLVVAFAISVVTHLSTDALMRRIGLKHKKQ